MATIRVWAKQIIQAPLPPLNVGAHKTTSSALHNLEYVGTLTPWPNFKSSVEAMYDAQAFSRSSTATVSPGLHNIDPEIVCVGDEHGVQGRFQQAIGQVLGVALEAQAVNLHFADFKCSGLQYKDVPDVVGLSTTVQGTQQLSLVGELKVPWVLPEHSLSDAYDEPQRLRHVLGQPVLYMGDLQSAFGFVSTYNETIFLHQAQLPSGQWHAEYSPVIHSTDVYEPSGSQGHGSDPSVSMRQCTEVTFTVPSPQKWVLEEKLTEDVKIPIAGTEYQSVEVRQRQAAPPRKHRELDALKDLKLRQCLVAPTLLAYKEGKQDNNGVVPDGYITYVVWDKVPGEPLNRDQVWDPQSGPLREAVRAKFRDVWEELRRYGWEPGMPALENIIYDEATGTMHIAGFRYSVPLDPESKFTDRTFVDWGLAIPPNNAGWKKDSTKWAW